MRKLSQQAEDSVGEGLFVLSAEDLFYLTIAYTDRLLEFDDPHDLPARQEAEGLWTEIKLQLRNEKNPSEQDLNTAATLVAMVIQRCLSSYNLWRYWDISESIADGIDVTEVRDLDRLSSLVEGIFMNPESLQYIKAWWQQQEEDPEWLSDELEDLIAKAERQNPDVPEIPGKAAILLDLKPYFGGNEIKAETFLRQIYNKADVDVAAVILSWKKKKEFGRKLNVSAFHKVLQIHQLYQASYDNLTKQIRD